jgi:tetratricopeptide (TPR) repeat protein
VARGKEIKMMNNLNSLSDSAYRKIEILTALSHSKSTASQPVSLAMVALAFLFGVVNTAWADRFQLKDGRSLSGHVVHTESTTSEKSQESRMAVEISPGVLVRIYSSDLARSGGHVKGDAKEQEYRKRIANLPDTAEAHYQAGQWCSQQGLRELARAHYLRTIDLDPNHKLARAAVEHVINSATGRWSRREDLMMERGKVYHQGRWQFPEYIPMDEQVEIEKKQKAALQKEISRLHNDALRGTPDRATQAVTLIRQLNDPLALDYISQLVLDRQKGAVSAATPELKQVYIAALSNFELPQAFICLAHASVSDADQRVRAAALDVLKRKGRETAIPVIASYLGNRNNQLINQAGYVLGQLNAHEALLPLIDALVTRHEVQPTEAPTYTPGGLVTGGQKPQLVAVENESVRAALAQITGQGNLGSDKAAWRAWYASIYATPADDLRRDP